MSLSALAPEQDSLQSPRPPIQNVAFTRAGSGFKSVVRATLLDFSAQESLTGFASTAGASEPGKMLAGATSAAYTIVDDTTQSEMVGVGYLGANPILFGVTNPTLVGTTNPALVGVNTIDAGAHVLAATNIFMYGANEFEAPSLVGVTTPSAFVNTAPTSAFVNTAANELDKPYVFDDRPAVNDFILEHRLRGLLAAASQPLNEAFGADTIKTLKIVTDDEGSQTLFCLVQVKSSVEDARRALESFDNQWWLAHCGPVAGKLNFDFEFV